MESTPNSPGNPVDREDAHTLSLCPVCLKRIDAVRRTRGDEVWLHKRCTQHGEFSTPIWRGSPFWAEWQRPKSASSPVQGRRPQKKGCPFDCGLCLDHRQRSCTVISDVTRRCDLACPVCFAASTREGPEDPDLNELTHRFETVSRVSPGSNIQLSGGEPTLREDLPDIVAIGKNAGFSFIQLNTNGIRLARDGRYLDSLASAGLDSIFLQFDGTREDIYRILRGRPLLETKLAAVSECGKLNLGVVLVVTVVPGVNDDDLGAILNLAVEKTPVVRGVHFQPISYFGRFPAPPGDESRITLPELMRAIETQTRGGFPVNRFSPSGCENAMCSFSTKFLVQTDRSVRPLLPIWQGCCGAPESAEEGARKSISQTARQWSAALPDSSTAECGKDANPPAAVPLGTKEPVDLDQFIRQVRTRTLAVSAMAFQDAWTLDLDRVRDCCIHVADAQDRLIPFCLYNLTSISGERLYRP